MAKIGSTSSNGKHRTNNPKRTSIGCSTFSRPKNKNKKRNWKKYRGQGR